MIETIKAVLEKFPDANLESKCCREKIAKKIQREIIADLSKRLNIKKLIREEDKMNWNSEIKIKHLLTEKEDHQNVQKSMNNIADVIHSNSAFNDFNTSLFRNIPVGDEFFKPVDYANNLMDRMYDFADENRILIK